MAETKISICSSALNLLGQPAITSLQDDTDASRTCAQLYDNIKWTLLSQYPWLFSKKKVQLARLVDAPLSVWTYQYTLPSDMVGGIRAVFPSDAVGTMPTQAFTVQGNKLLTNLTEIWIDYQYNVPEASMPPHFVQLLVYVLAFNFAVPITEQETKAELWRGVAYGMPSDNMRGGFFRVAANIDGSGAPVDAVDTSELIAVRMN